jgi:hypothetical protein
MKQIFRQTLLFLLLFEALFQPLQAQPLADDTRGPLVPVYVKAWDSNKPIQLYSGSHALLIGNSRYAADSGFKSLTSIPQELDQIERVLKNQGFSVDRVPNQNKKGIKTAVDQFIEQYGYQADNRLLIYYSGHGDTAKERGYLIPAGGISWDKAEAQERQGDFFSKALSMTMVKSWTREI